MMKNNSSGFNSEDGDFIASRQMMDDVEVWNIGGKMCIALNDDPVYITKEQAMKFFDLEEKEDSEILESVMGCSKDGLDKLTVTGKS